MKAARREDGAVLVEFALVLAPLLFLIFGFMYIGLAVNAKIDATHLTAEAARYIAVNQNPGSPGPINTYILDRGGTAAIKNGTLTICLQSNAEKSPPTSGQVGDPVKVVLQANSANLVPLVGSLPLIGSVTTLTIPTLTAMGETTMRLEAVPSKFLPLPAC